MGRVAHIPSEHRREMRLRLKSDAQRDIDEALSGILEHGLRAPDALPQ